MLTEDIREQLTIAGNKHDGHVTNGSLDEQMKVVQKALEDACPAFYRDEEKTDV